MKAVNAYGSVVAKEEHENPCEFIPRIFFQSTYSWFLCTNDKSKEDLP